MSQKELASKVKCPHCGKLIDIEQVTDVVVEPTRGEYERRIIVRKSTQTTLRREPPVGGPKGPSGALKEEAL